MASRGKPRIAVLIVALLGLAPAQAAAAGDPGPQPSRPRPPAQMAMADFYNPHVTLRQRFVELADRRSFADAHAPGLKQALMAFAVGFACEHIGSDLPSVRRVASYLAEQNRLLAQRLAQRGDQDPRSVRISPVELRQLAKRYPDAVQLTAQRAERFGAHAGIADAMVLDVRATAALLHEIGFTEGLHVPRRAIVRGVDLGAGSGILSIAGALAARRHGAPAHVSGFERVSGMADNAQRTLAPLQDAQCRIEIEHADITRPSLYQRIHQDLVRQGVPLHLWISETFNLPTPQPVVRGDAVEWRGSRAASGATRGRAAEDPFVEVVNLSVQHLPDFLARARTGELYLFPDFVHGRLHLDKFRSTLQLASAGDRHVPLYEISGLFDEFEDFGLRERWPDDPQLRKLSEAQSASPKKDRRNAAAEKRQKAKEREKKRSRKRNR